MQRKYYYNYQEGGQHYTIGLHECTKGLFVDSTVSPIPEIY